MNKKIAQRLLNRVVEDYNTIASQFDRTRQKDWKEFDLFLKYIKKGAKIADLGCGNGRLYKYLKTKKEIKYIGIDNNNSLLAKAKKQHNNAKFINGDLLKLPLKTESIDIAIAVASIHHIPSQKLRAKSLQEIARIIKNNGILIVTAWNLFQPKYKKFIWQSRLRHILSLGKYDARDTFIPWGKTGVKRYYYAFKEKELQKLLEKNNFKIIEKKIGNNFTFVCKKQNQSESSK